MSVTRPVHTVVARYVIRTAGNVPVNMVSEADNAISVLLATITFLIVNVSVLSEVFLIDLCLHANQSNYRAFFSRQPTRFNSQLSTLRAFVTVIFGRWNASLTNYLFLY